METADREESYKTVILDLETENKSIKQGLARFQGENERLNSGFLELQQHCDQIEDQRRQYKSEIREFKVRENRNLADYAELEDENISLQKQCSQLQQTQVNFEVMKHEIRQLQETEDDMRIQLEESVTLKRIVEKNLEEALNSLQHEREQKHAYKKELDQRLNQESMFNLSNLAQLGGLSEGLSGMVYNHDNTDRGDEDGDENNPALKRIEADFKQEGVKSPAKPSPGKVNDILSEIQQNEVKILKSC